MDDLLMRESEAMAVLATDPVELRRLVKVGDLACVESPGTNPMYDAAMVHHLLTTRHRFRYLERPAGWSFDNQARAFPNPWVVSESSISGLRFGVANFDQSLTPLRGRTYSTYHAYGKPCGDPDSPIYNPNAGLESQRGYGVIAPPGLRRLRECGSIVWEPEVNRQSEGPLFYFLPESLILRCVEEAWSDPRERRWITEAVYLVVADPTFAPG